MGLLRRVARARLAGQVLRRLRRAGATGTRYDARTFSVRFTVDGDEIQILAERDRFKDAAAAWDSFGAMWMLSQRAMKRVALDLAAQQGVSEEDVVARALDFANDVLNGDGVDLGGTIVEPQMAHIARHRAFLRKQFRRS